MTRKDSPGMEYLRKMSPEDREKRRRALWKDFVLYLCPRCGGIWYPRMRKPEDTGLLPASFPCGSPCFGEMVKQREPRLWEAGEQAKLVTEEA